MTILVDYIIIYKNNKLSSIIEILLKLLRYFLLKINTIDDNNKLILEIFSLISKCLIKFFEAKSFLSLSFSNSFKAIELIFQYIINFYDNIYEIPQNILISLCKFLILYIFEKKYNFRLHLH